jgi:hypothetical protein
MTLTDSQTFLTATGYDLPAIMRDAHRRAKKMRACTAVEPYANYFAFYLEQVWITAKHNFRARKALTAAPTIIREGTLAYRELATDGRLR